MNPVRPTWFYTYALISEKDGAFYTGTTNNLKKRLEDHNAGMVSSTKYRRPLKLIYFKGCLNKNAAYKRERYLKTGMGKQYLNNLMEV